MAIPLLHWGIFAYESDRKSEAMGVLRKCVALQPEGPIGILFLALSMESTVGVRDLKSLIVEHFKQIVTSPDFRPHLARWFARWMPSEIEAMMFGAIERASNHRADQITLLNAIPFLEDSEPQRRLRTLRDLIVLDPPVLPAQYRDFFTVSVLTHIADLLGYCRTRNLENLFSFLATGMWSETSGERPLDPLQYHPVRVAKLPRPSSSEVSPALDAGLDVIYEPDLMNLSQMENPTQEFGAGYSPSAWIEHLRKHLVAMSPTILRKQLDMVRNRRLQFAGSDRSLPIVDAIVFTSPDKRRGFGEIAIRIDERHKTYVILTSERFLPNYVFDLDSRGLYYIEARKPFLNYMVKNFEWLGKYVDDEELNKQPPTRKKIRILLNPFDYVSHYFYNGVSAIQYLNDNPDIDPRDVTIEFRGTDFIDLEAGFDRIWPDWSLPSIKFLPRGAEPRREPGEMSLPLSGMLLSNDTASRCQEHLLSRSTSGVKRFVDSLHRRNEILIVFCHRVDNKLILNNGELLERLSDLLSKNKLKATVFVHTFSAVKKDDAPEFRSVETGQYENLPAFESPDLTLVTSPEISFPDTAYLLHSAAITMAMNSSGATMPLLMAAHELILFNTDALRYEARSYHESYDCTTHDVDCPSIDPSYAHSDYAVPLDAFETAVTNAIANITMETLG